MIIAILMILALLGLFYTAIFISPSRKADRMMIGFTIFIMVLGMTSGFIALINLDK